jgi:isocitrate dehydrogenase
MQKIQMTTPLVEMDGDEMTRILWKMIKDELILPFVDLKTEYYDLGLPERERTKDKVTMDSALATKRLGVAVKCATITPNKQRVEEYDLTEMWKSPNGTIRAVLDGTVFRAPILIDSVKPIVRSWKKPITIARHAYGDVYRATEYRVGGPGKAELVFTGEDGSSFRETVYEFECGGVLQGQYNKDSSIMAPEKMSIARLFLNGKTGKITLMVLFLLVIFMVEINMVRRSTTRVLSQDGVLVRDLKEESHHFGWILKQKNIM